MGFKGLVRVLENAAWFEHYGEEPRNIILSTTPIQLTDPASMGTLVEEMKALLEKPVFIIVDTVTLWESAGLYSLISGKTYTF